MVARFAEQHAFLPGIASVVPGVLFLRGLGPAACVSCLRAGVAATASAGLVGIGPDRHASRPAVEASCIESQSRRGAVPCPRMRSFRAANFLLSCPGPTRWEAGTRAACGRSLTPPAQPERAARQGGRGDTGRAHDRVPYLVPFFFSRFEAEFMAREMRGLGYKVKVLASMQGAAVSPRPREQ